MEILQKFLLQDIVEKAKLPAGKYRNMNGTLSFMS